MILLRSIGAFLLLSLVVPALFAQTAGVSVINQRNVILVVPTPNPQNPPSSNALLTRNGRLGATSNSRRVNDVNPPAHPQHRDPLRAPKPAPFAPKRPLTKKFMANASASLATTAPPESSGVFPKGK